VNNSIVCRRTSSRAGRVVGAFAVLVVASVWVGCDSWITNSPTVASVEGCTDAVDHLHACCPRYGSYISCRYSLTAANADARVDLAERPSRCLSAASCDAIARAVVGGRELCGVHFADRSCR
jgi:hypothetical protein